MLECMVWDGELLDAVSWEEVLSTELRKGVDDRVMSCSVE